MTVPHRPSFCFLGVLAMGAALTTAAAGAQAISEFSVPSGNRPLHLAPGPGGMWFTEGSTSQIGRITSDGHVTEFPVNRPAGRIVTGPDGNLWFTSSRFLSRMTPAGVVTDFPLRGNAWGITVGPDSNIWFTEVGTFPDNNGYLGRATVRGEITELRINSWAEDITTGADGNFWIPDWTEVGFDAIVRVTPSGVETRFVLPGGLHAPGDVGPAAVVAGSDGNLWFTEARTPTVGRITPSGAISTFGAPGAWGIAAGPDGNIWFTETDANKIGRLTTSGELLEFAIPTPNSQPWGISAGPDGNIWFAESGTNRIGKLSVVGTCDANTLCLGGNRFHITATWQSPTGSGQGYAVSMTPATGYFWFFDSASVEVVVKIVDGCSLNGRKWVFASGLTNVKVVLTVFDSQSGALKTYTNPEGTAFLPVQDTDAFSTCP